MPIYEYECSLCHFRFERRQRFDEEPACLCPRCQGRSRRVLHSVPILFKGSGFYTTDYGRGSGNAPSRSKSESEKPVGKKETKDGGEAKSEGAPAKGI